MNSGEGPRVRGLDHIVLINLHQAGREVAPHARHPTPGSADCCLLTDRPLAEVVAHIRSCGVEILAGPLRRTGAVGTLESVYLRDPDGNLIEIARPMPAE